MPPPDEKRADPNAIGELDTIGAPSDATPSSGPAGAGGPRLSDGEVVAGRYRIVRYIAAGGMGEVYEAEDGELGGRVALKTIRSPDVDSGAEERFKREIQLSRKVTHSTVCRIFDVGYHVLRGGQRVMFLTMELLVGETLLARIRRAGPIPLDEALHLVRQIAAALTAAHAVGVVHRDLKSANIMLSDRQDGTQRATVMDFGLAHISSAEDGNRSLTGSGGIVGTPGYMAPEQVEGGHVTPGTDFYALGVVMFEMVTGRLPFDGATPLSIAAKRLTSPPPSPKQLRPDLPQRWDAAILACLQRRPEDRPSSARAILDLLEDEPGSVRSRLQGIERRAGRRIPLLTVVLGLLLLAVAVQAWRRRGQGLAAEVMARGVTLGSLIAADAAAEAGYGALLRNALRTDLEVDLPVIDARDELRLGDGRVLAFGHARPRPSEREPLRLDGHYAVSGDGADRKVQLTLRLVDPGTGKERAAVVEAGTVRRIRDLVLHSGDRLRGLIGLEPGQAMPLSKAGRAALEEGMEQLRNGDFAVALATVEKALAQERNAVELRFLLTRVLVGLGDDIASGVAMERTVALGPVADPFWAKRIEAMRLRGDPVRSAAALEDLYHRNPQDLDLAFDLASIYVRAQRGPDALALLDSLGRTPLAEVDRLRLAMTRLLVAERLNRADEAQRDFQTVQAQARAAGRRGIEVQALRIGCLRATADHQQALSDSLCGELRALAETMTLPKDEVAAETAWAEVRLSSGAQAAVYEHARRARQLATQLGNQGILADALNILGMAAWESGAAEGTAELFEEALTLARDGRNSRVSLVALGNLAAYAASEGHLTDGVRYAHEALELANDTGSAHFIAQAECRLALAELDLGDIAASRKGLTNAVSLLGSRRFQRDDEHDCARLDALLAEAEGRLDEALARTGQNIEDETTRGGGAMTAPSRDEQCMIRYLKRDWPGLLRCADDLVAIASKHQLRAQLKSASLYRAAALLELHRPGAEIAPFVLEHDDVEMKLERAWMDLLVVAVQRRMGMRFDELSAKIDAVIATAVSMQHVRLELLARLERLALLSRDRRPNLVAEQRDLEARARTAGFSLVPALLHVGAR